MSGSWEATIEQQSIDQLLDTLKTQKAELERKEQVVGTVIKRKVEKQKERLDRSGVIKPEIATGEPALPRRVSSN